MFHSFTFIDKTLSTVCLSTGRGFGDGSETKRMERDMGKELYLLAGLTDRKTTLQYVTTEC